MAEDAPVRAGRWTRRVARAVLACVAGAAVGALLVSRGPSASLGGVVDLATARKVKVARLLLNKGVSKEILCSGVTFAYCGSATCDVLSNTTAACGCKIYRKREVKFKISWTTAILVGSSAYRKAVMAVLDGDDDRATTLICDAIKDGSLYRESYGTEYGSVSLDVDDRRVLGAASDDDDDGSGSVLNASLAASSATKASCMGAPCTFESWDDDCGATCVCPISADEDDVGTCLRNGVGSTYWDDFESLMGIIDDIQARFRGDGDLAASVTRAKKCRADCTVHHQDR